MPVLVLFLHLYLVGAIISIFFIVTQSEWSMDESNSISIASRMDHWKSDYMIGFKGVKIAFAAKDDFEKEVSRYTWFTAPFVLVFVFFGSPKSWGSGKFKDASKYGSHGTSRWAKQKEIFRNGEITGNPVNEKNGAGIILGYEKKAFGKGEYITVPPDSEINQNVIVYGNSGIGKGFTYVKTQIFHTMTPFVAPTKKREAAAERRATPSEYSLFITDPKGEHYTDTAASLESAGYEVYVFNLIHMNASHRWNPMDYIDEDLDAEKLASLIISQSGDEKAGDPFWSKAERALMSAILLFVKYELPPEQNNIANVLHIGLAYGRDEDVLNLLFDSLPYNHPAVSQYNIFRVAPAETRAGILIGFGTQISLFGYKKISDLTSQSDFRLDDMARKKTAVFLIIPVADVTYAALTTLFLNQAIQQWWRVADENGGVCPVGIRILGDELPNIGKIPLLGERSSVMRSLGISIQIIVQAKSQLYRVYKEEADTIIQNCDTVIFLGTNDKKTAEELSNDLGDMTIQVSSTSQQQNMFFQTNPNESQQYQARKLMDPAELRRATRKLNIIVQSGGYPFKTVKTPFIKHPNSKGYKKRDPKALLPPAHKGFELFSRADYDNICGLNLLPTNVLPDEARENFKQNHEDRTGANLLDQLLKEPIENDVLDQEIEEDFVEDEVVYFDSLIPDESEVAAAEQDIYEQDIQNVIDGLEASTAEVSIEAETNDESILVEEIKYAEEITTPFAEETEVVVMEQTEQGDKAPVSEDQPEEAPVSEGQEPGTNLKPVKAKSILDLV